MMFIATGVFNFCEEILQKQNKKVLGFRGISLRKDAIIKIFVPWATRRIFLELAERFLDQPLVKWVKLALEIRLQSKGLSIRFYWPTDVKHWPKEQIYQGRQRDVVVIIDSPNCVLCRTEDQSP